MNQISISKQIVGYLIITIVLLTGGCKDVIYENDLRNVPVYLTFDELRSSVKKVESIDLIHPGKIYFKEGYIFINEEMKGIHVIDNRDPHNPVNIGFIEILGNMDMAIKNNTLYADSYVDLVAIDISDLNNPNEIKRVKNVFPYTVPELKDESYLMAELDEKKGVVIDWEIDYSRLRVERRNYPIYNRGWFSKSNSGEMRYFDANLSAFSSSSASSGTNGFTSSSTQNASFGVGGSMARFGLNGNYLYTVDRDDFHIFNIENDKLPFLENEMPAGDDVETMFIHDNHMFLGTMTGMLVFSLNDPINPIQINKYEHLRSCDPVVVQDHIAYVTLRGGNKCGQAVSALEVLALSDDYRDSERLYSYSLKEPYGLGIDDEILFVCDGLDGLIVYDASELAFINRRKLAQFSDIKAFDVIPFNDYLFMVGEDGFYQYDYSDISNIQEVSFIKVMSQNEI